MPKISPNLLALGGDINAINGQVDVDDSELTAGWIWASLKDFGELDDGDWILKQYYTPTGVRLLQIGDIGSAEFIGKSDRFISIDAAQSLGCTFLKPGQVLISRMPDPIGRACIMPMLPYPAITAVDVTILTPNPDVADALFLMYLLNSQINLSQCLRFSGGATRQRISRSNLSNVRLPLPPLPEQRAIASVLRTVHQSKEACESVIAATRQLKQSLLQYLFTYGPVPFGQADQVPLKETEIGLIPEHWTSYRIAELGRIITGKTPSTKIADFWNGIIPFITPVDLEDREISRAERTISEAGLSEIKEIPRGSVAVSCIGYIGKVGLVMIERSATNQQINTIVPRPCHNPTFLSYRLQTMRDQLNSAASITTVPILNKSNFENIKTWLPDLPEQTEIAAQLSAVDAKLAAEEIRRQALNNLFQSLLHHLMTGKVRVTA